MSDRLLISLSSGWPLARRVLVGWPILKRPTPQFITATSEWLGDDSTISPEDLTMSMAAAGAAAAVAAAAELMRQEEEEMTPYSDKDLAEGWEFKILRASLAAFGKPERFRAILEEEKKGGWILVEKFDDERIRLKRPVGTKVLEGDFSDGYDPYRSMVGPTAEQRKKIILFLAGPLIFVVIIIIAIISTT